MAGFLSEEIYKMQELIEELEKKVKKINKKSEKLLNSLIRSRGRFYDARG